MAPSYKLSLAIRAALIKSQIKMENYQTYFPAAAAAAAACSSSASLDRVNNSNSNAEFQGYNDHKPSGSWDYCRGWKLIRQRQA
ncbi:hypothetical protein CISIN_1g042992mg [Citrus sinensis]|uniref:Uncharacterized protein n=1 Tax=Citrus sinensis TaxID=2711 RepID=A0A067GT27_CITSI|nr:hypothetical protein CISIN_1g042992mg [Citrus sinensis]